MKRSAADMEQEEQQKEDCWMPVKRQKKYTNFPPLTNPLAWIRLSLIVHGGLPPLFENEFPYLTEWQTYTYRMCMNAFTYDTKHDAYDISYIVCHDCALKIENLRKTQTIFTPLYFNHTGSFTELCKYMSTYNSTCNFCMLPVISIELLKIAGS